MNAPQFLTSEDAERIQREFGIPVDSFCPRTYWIVSLDRESHLPSDEELRQIRSYCEFKIRDSYLYGTLDRILAMPLPKADQHNTVIFRKGHRSLGRKEHWFRRKMSWKDGLVYAPNCIAENYHGLSLVEIMDAEESICSIIQEPWKLWKSEHPEIFPAP